MSFAKDIYSYMYMCSINTAASASKCIMQVYMCLSKCRLFDGEKITNECLRVENTCIL